MNSKSIADLVSIYMNGEFITTFSYTGYAEQERIDNFVLASFSKTKQSKGTEVIKLISVPVEYGYKCNIVTRKLTKWQRFKRKIGL